MNTIKASNASSKVEDDHLVSVVVIGYNQERYIEQALRSVLEQTWSALEVVFMDDGSKDRTLKIAQDLEQENPRLKVHTQQNSGPAVARMNASKLVSQNTEFIAFLDGDDVQHSEFVATAIRYLESNPAATAVIPNLWNINQHGESINGRPFRRWRPSKLGLPKLMKSTEHETPFTTFYCASGTVPFFLARYSAYKNLVGWDPRLWPFEDTDMLCQLAITGKVHALPDKLVGYRIHENQGTRSGAQQSKHWNGKSDLIMREKWNLGQGLTPQQRRTVRNACIYYRQVHEPLMTLAVSGRAFRELLNRPSIKRLKWFAWVFRQASWRVIKYKLLFWRTFPSWNPTLPESAYKGLGQIPAAKPGSVE